MLCNIQIWSILFCLAISFKKNVCWRVYWGIKRTKRMREHWNHNTKIHPFYSFILWTPFFMQPLRKDRTICFEWKIREWFISSFLLSCNFDDIHFNNYLCGFFHKFIIMLVTQSSQALFVGSSVSIWILWTRQTRKMLFIESKWKVNTNLLGNANICYASYSTFEL